MYPTSALLKCRTRVNPSSVGEREKYDGGRITPAVRVRGRLDYCRQSCACRWWSHPYSPPWERVRLRKPDAARAGSAWCLCNRWPKSALMGEGKGLSALIGKGGRLRCPQRQGGKPRVVPSSLVLGVVRKGNRRQTRMVTRGNTGADVSPEPAPHKRENLEV